MDNIYFVTSNENKVKEAENILGVKISRVDLDIDEIQGVDLEEVAKHKAKQAFEAIKKPVFVEDSGLFVEAWNNFPGALTKWMEKCFGNKGICELLKTEDRTASAKACICFYDGEEFRIFSGEIKGKIAEEPKGKNGFGWDEIFQPGNCDKTFAEMTQEKKNKMSHRKRALVKMKEFLNKKI